MWPALHLSSLLFLVGFVFPSLLFSVWCFVDRCFSIFLLAIVLAVLLRFMESDYPYAIFKLFCQRVLIFCTDICVQLQYQNTKKELHICFGVAKSCNLTWNSSYGCCFFFVFFYFCYKNYLHLFFLFTWGKRIFKIFDWYIHFFLNFLLKWKNVFTWKTSIIHFTCIIKTQISNLVRTTLFLNNINQVRSMQKDWKDK